MRDLPADEFCCFVFLFHFPFSVTHCLCQLYPDVTQFIPKKFKMWASSLLANSPMKRAFRHPSSSRRYKKISLSATTTIKTNFCSQLLLQRPPQSPMWAWTSDTPPSSSSVTDISPTIRDRIVCVSIVCHSQSWRSVKTYNCFMKPN